MRLPLSEERRREGHRADCVKLKRARESMVLSATAGVCCASTVEPRLLLKLFARAEKRVQSDLEEMTKHPIEGIAVIPRDNNIGVWQIFVEGTKVSGADAPPCRDVGGRTMRVHVQQKRWRRRAAAPCIADGLALFAVSMCWYRVALVS